MHAPRSARAGAFAQERSGPLLIAHAAGNDARRLESVLTGSPDFVEVDLWVHDGRFEARHERRVIGAPLLFEKWYLRFAPRHPFGLDELISAVGDRAGIFLDLKNDGDEAARLIRRALTIAGGQPRLVASSQQWELLRGLARVAPEVELFYSADVRAKLDLFLSVEERDAHPAGISCHHELLDEATVRRLHERGLAVVAWTVDEPERAAALATWGVDGITTHRVAELRAHLFRE